MIKNNNAGVIRKISFRSLKAGKMRNFFVVITVALTAALISGLAGFSLGLQKEEERQLELMQHVIYMDVSDEQIEDMMKDERIEELVAYKQGKAFEIDGYSIRAAYFPKDSHKIRTNASDICQGSFPEKINEIVVDKAYMESIGKEPVLGAEVEITWLDGITEKYIVSGYTDYKTSLKSFTVLFSEEYAQNGSQLKDIPFSAAVRIYGADGMSRDEFLNEIRGIGEQMGVPRPNVNENNRFVTNITTSAGEMLMVISVSAVILFASILVIYSIFYISISGRIRQFGQLRTIGMTAGQIKKAVNTEGLLLGTAGIIIGLALGTIFAFYIKPAGFYLPNTLAIWVITAATDMIAVMLSIRKPAKLAASVSPVEAAKASGYESDNKKIRHRKLTPFGLARISSGRNRKKSRMTAFSLGIGGVLFLGGATLIASFNQEEYSRQSEFYFGEYILYFSTNARQTAEHGITDIQLSNVLNDALKEEIASLPGVSDITVGECFGITYEYNNYREDDSATPFSREEAEVLSRHSEENVIFDYDKMVSEKEIIIISNDIAEEIFGWRFRTGDRVLLQWYDGNAYQEDYFKIAGCIDAMDLYHDSVDKESARRLMIGNGWFLIPRELAESMVSGSYNFYDRFIISVPEWRNDETIKEYLEGVAYENPTLSFGSLEEQMQNDELSFVTLQYMIYGISAFIIAFALINLTNTLVSNVVSHRHEFAMLCSIGMSGDQLSKMIIGEGLILAVRNIVITAVGGTAAGYMLIYLAGKAGIEYLHWHFPLWYLAGYAIFVIAIPVIISWIVIRILEKKTLVERLRETE